MSGSDPHPAVHHAAREGFSQQTERYGSGRPDYPDAVADWLRDGLGLGSGSRVLDLGAGTGKFTACLAAAGAAITAVEPSPAMRAAFARRFPDLPCLEGTATAIPLADGALDAVVCGQAFHWFATEAALAEIGRVLVPGGRLGLVWNVRDEAVPWVAALTELYEGYAGDAPRYRDGTWRRVFPGSGFGPLQEADCSHLHCGPPEQVILDRTLSISFVAALPAEERRALEARLRAFVAGRPELAGKPEIAFPYRTLMAWCQRRI